MRENHTSGTVQGVPGNRHSYCDKPYPMMGESNYCAESTLKPYWAKCRSKVKAEEIRSRSITAKLAASVREKSLSVYW